MKYIKIVAIILIVNVFFSLKLDAQVGINIDTPLSTLDINGDLIITQTDPMPGLFLGIDRADNGHVGTLVSPPYIFAQSSKEQIFSASEVADYNAARGVVVKWDPATEILNSDIATYNLTENAFVFTSKYLCEISGFICMKTGAANTDTAGSICFLNIKIQQRKSGTSTWTDVGMTRMVLVYPILDQNTSTIVFTPCVAQFNPGDALRILLSRPSASLGTAWGAKAAGIAKPGGIPYTRGLKVLSL